MLISGLAPGRHVDRNWTASDGCRTLAYIDPLWKRCPRGDAVVTKKNLSLIALCLLGLTLGGCNGAFVGNFFVLFVSMGIFFGTLNLGRFTPGGSTPRTPTKGSSATESSS
jgi:hypothetical protein